MPATVYLRRRNSWWFHHTVEWMGLTMDRIWRGRGSKKGISRAGTGPGKRVEAGPCRQCRRAWATELWWKTRKTVGSVSELGSMGHQARGILIEISQTKVSISGYVQEMVHALTSLYIASCV